MSLIQHPVDHRLHFQGMEMLDHIGYEPQWELGINTGSYILESLRKSPANGENPVTSKDILMF